MSVNPKGVPITLRKMGRESYRTPVVERDQPGVERGIKMSGQKQSVVDIKPLGVGIAFRPGLDVAGAQ